MPSEEEDESWDDDYDVEKEEDDETTVCKSCENMYKMNHMMRPLGSCYLTPIHSFHEENNAYMMMGNPCQLSKNDDASSKKDDEEEEEEEETTDWKSCGEASEINFEPWRTSYIPSQYHHRNEEDTGCRILRESGIYELLDNDDSSSEEEDDSWDDEEVMEWMWKNEIVSVVSLVVHDDEDDDEDEDEDDDEVWDMLQGFVDVKKEEIANEQEFGEVETLSPDCDWVYVTRN